MPKCLQAQSVLICVTPTLGSIVVNGKLPIGTDVSVAAEKNVDFPTFAFPKSPICMENQNRFIHISIAAMI